MEAAQSRNSQEPSAAVFDEFIVFISYNGGDVNLAERVDRGLRERGIKTWFDKSDLRKGAEVRDEIKEALRKCSAAVCLMGADLESDRSSYQHNEIQVIKQRQRRRGEPYMFVLPVLLPKAGGEMPFEFNTYQSLDFRHGISAPDLDRLVRELHRTRKRVERLGRLGEKMPSTLRPAFYELDWLGISGAVFLVLVLGALFWAALRSPVKPFVAVLAFDQEAGSALGHEWISTALTEMLVMDLESGEKIRLLDRPSGWEVDRQPEIDGSSRDGLRYFGVRHVLSGSYRVDDLEGVEPAALPGNAIPAELRVRLSLRDLETRKELCSTEEFGKVSDLPEIIQSLAACPRQRLVPLSESLPVRHLQSTFPMEAAEAYFKGLVLLRRFDTIAAVQHFEEAARQAPEHPAPLMGLAEAWYERGEPRKAEAVAAAAVRKAHRLSVQERKELLAVRAELAGDWAKAIDLYRKLYDFRGTPRYALRLAAALAESGRSDEARAWLAELQARWGPYPSTDPRLQLEEARILNRIGDHERAAWLAGLAASKALEATAELIAAQAYLEQASALASLGDADAYAKAKDLLKKARSKFEAAGDVAHMAFCDELLGDILFEQEEFDEAGRQFEDCRKRYRDELGRREDEARSTLSLAAVKSEQRKFGEAARLVEEALAAAESAGSLESRAAALNERGYLLFREGRLQEAEPSFSRAWRTLIRLREPDAPRALVAMGEIAAIRGWLADAERKLDAASATLEETGPPQELAFCLLQLGRVFAFQDRQDAAREQLRKALAMLPEAEPPQPVGERGLVLIELAELALDEGNPREAERLSMEALKDLPETKSPGGAARALSAQARALLARGDAGRALGLAQRAMELARETGRFDVSEEVEIAASRVRAAQSNPSSATAIVAALRRQAEHAASRGWTSFEFFARLAAGEIEISRGDQERGRAELQSLIRDAGRPDRGFAHIVRRAREIMAAGL